MTPLDRFLAHQTDWQQFVAEDDADRAARGLPSAGAMLRAVPNPETPDMLRERLRLRMAAAEAAGRERMRRVIAAEKLHERREV